MLESPKIPKSKEDLSSYIMPYEWPGSYFYGEEEKKSVNEVIDAKSVAISLQRIITILALTLVRNNELINPIDLEHLDDGLCNLSQLVEILQAEK